MRVTLSATLACLALTFVASPSATPSKPDVPGAIRAASALPQLHSLLVSSRGELIIEH